MRKFFFAVAMITVLGLSFLSTEGKTSAKETIPPVPVGIDLPTAPLEQGRAEVVSFFSGDTATKVVLRSGIGIKERNIPEGCVTVKNTDAASELNCVPGDYEVSFSPPIKERSYTVSFTVIAHYGEAQHSRSRAVDVVPYEAPSVVVEGFRGASQWRNPEILNSGTITLTIDLNGHSWDELNGGRMSILNDRGQIYSIQNVWTHIEGDLYQWVQYVPYSVEAFWIDTLIHMQWKGYGPWEVLPEENGLSKIEKITTLRFVVNPPLYRDWDGKYDPTWDWTFEVEPEWATTQYPWLNVHMDIITLCDGHGDNHAGEFFWDGINPKQVFGNGVFRQWVKEPLAKVTWKAKAAGWTITGQTEGPECWSDLNYLPTVNR